MISEAKFQEVSKDLGIEVAVLKAVAEVESSGEGFLADGQPKILFEPHIFWKNLGKRGIDPNLYIKDNEDILYPKWKSGAYGKVSEQHSRLQRATKINREAALESASWGSFQVLLANWQSIGYESLQDFINDAYEGDDGHFEMFLKFIKANNLVKYLKTRQWAEFAKRYNGSSYKVNKYDTKLEAAYRKYSK